MGFIHSEHGPNRITAEERRESFVIHPGYGHEVLCPTCMGDPERRPMGYCAGGCSKAYREGLVERPGHLPWPDDSFGRNWRERPHPEFVLADVPDLIRALADLPTCPPEVRVALQQPPVGERDAELAFYTLALKAEIAYREGLPDAKARYGDEGTKGYAHICRRADLAAAEGACEGPRDPLEGVELPPPDKPEGGFLGRIGSDPAAPSRDVEAEPSDEALNAAFDAYMAEGGEDNFDALRAAVRAAYAVDFPPTPYRGGARC